VFRTSVARWVAPPYETVPLDPAGPDPLNRSRDDCVCVCVLRCTVLHMTRRGRRRYIIIIIIIMVRRRVWCRCRGVNCSSSSSIIIIMTYYYITTIPTSRYRIYCKRHVSRADVGKSMVPMQLHPEMQSLRGRAHRTVFGVTAAAKIVNDEPR